MSLLIPLAPFSDEYIFRNERNHHYREKWYVISYFWWPIRFFSFWHIELMCLMPILYGEFPNEKWPKKLTSVVGLQMTSCTFLWWIFVEKLRKTLQQWKQKWNFLVLTTSLDSSLSGMLFLCVSYLCWEFPHENAINK